MAALKITKHYQKPWQLLVSVCLSRTNAVTKDLVEIEERYTKLMERMEVEGAVYNDHEIRKMELKEVVSQGKTSKKLSEKDEEKISEASRLLANIQDQEDMWVTDTAKIKIASKSTPCDGDTKSIRRLLDQKIHMVVEDGELLKEKASVFPYTTIDEGESLRQASERLLETHGISSNNTLYMSNAPAGVVKIRFKEDEERGHMFQGAKVFFTKVLLKSSDDVTSQNIEWLSVDELKTRSGIEYFDRVKKFV